MPQMDGWQTIETVRTLYTQKQTEIDKYKTKETGHKKFKIITLQMPYFALHTAIYIDDHLRLKAQDIGIDHL